MGGCDGTSSGHRSHAAAAVLTQCSHAEKHGCWIHIGAKQHFGVSFNPF